MSGETCPNCIQADSYSPVPFRNNYDLPHRLDVWVRTPSLALVAGCGNPRRGAREALEVAMGLPDDPEALRDAAAFLERRLHELDVERLGEEPPC